MTDAELDELERQLAAANAPRLTPQAEHRFPAAHVSIAQKHVPALIAEVRRLRKDNAVLAKHDPWRPVLFPGSIGQWECATCEARHARKPGQFYPPEDHHAESCEWLAAHERATGVEYERAEMPTASHVTCPSGWLPTPENLRALPEPLRKYVYELETNAWPAGMVAENVCLKENVRAMSVLLEEKQAPPAEPAKKLTQEDIDRIMPDGHRRQIEGDPDREWYSRYGSRVLRFLNGRWTRLRDGEGLTIVYVETVSDLERERDWLRGGT